MQTIYTYFVDPGHAWLCVSPRAELHRLKIADKISCYSYQYCDKVYLEEDVDWRIFTQAKTEQQEPIELKEVFHEFSPVREYLHYRPKY